MKVHLVQMAPRLGDVRANLDRHLEALERARAAGAELVVFPELSLTGYSLKDLVSDVAVTPSRSPVFKELLDAGRGMSVVVGFVEEKEDERGLFYNSAAFLAEGRILHIHRKVFLPTFGMFEEAKFFAQGRNVLPFRAPFGRGGADDLPGFPPVRVELPPLRRRRRGLHRRLGRAGTRGRRSEGFETSRMWELMGEAISHFSTAFVLYCNRVGSEDGVTFAGGSFVFSPEGELLARAPDLDEEVLACDLDLGLVRDVRKSWTFKRDDRPEIILHSLERIVRRYED